MVGNLMNRILASRCLKAVKKRLGNRMFNYLKVEADERIARALTGPIYPGKVIHLQGNIKKR